MLQAVMPNIQISGRLRTASRTIRQLGERVNANDVTNDSTRTERLRVTTHGRDRHSMMSHFRDRLMPAVVTARNTPGPHNNSATGLFSGTEMCCSVYAWKVGKILCEFRDLGTGDLRH